MSARTIRCISAPSQFPISDLNSMSVQTAVPVTKSLIFTDH